MPLYEYECFVCHRRFQRIQKVAATPVAACPTCGGKVRRLLGVPALQFKGTGWYVTDYGKGNGASRSTESKESSADSSPPAVDSSKPGSSEGGSATPKPAKSAGN
jgi:putative FmdB family regulatory protein